MIILSSLFLEIEFSWLLSSPKRDIYRLKPPFQTASFFPNKISFFLFSPLAQVFACNSRNTNYVQSTYVAGRSIFFSAINLSNIFQNSESLKTRAEFQIESS